MQTQEAKGNPQSTDVNQDLIYREELAHLGEISEKLEVSLIEAEQTLAQMEEEYTEARFYMSENRSEIDPHEMFQAEMALRQIDSSGGFAVKMKDRMVKLLDSPYFARIDFQPEDDETAAVFYIGRFSYSWERKILIYDWRAPVSSMFYDYETGPAGYDAPRGRIEGNLTRKRQFKIKDGILEYALESSMQIQDDVLQKELSHTSDEKMKSIISTIQKEQNLIIRNEHKRTMIIQGVAGSGKTSIALHRIAFLLYRYKDQLSAENVTILSPNKVFGDYISNVLPELGEESVFALRFYDLADIQLEGLMDYEPDQEFAAPDKAWIDRAKFKSTLEFVRQMDAFIAQLPEMAFEAADFVFEPFILSAAWIQGRYDAYKRYPIKKRLDMICDDIEDRLLTDNVYEEPLPKRRTVMRLLKAMLKFKNTMQVYKAFYRFIGQPKQFVLAGKHRLEWHDVFPFLYLHASFEGLQENRRIRHVVIDEMQDYTPIQYAFLNRLFQCPKTILGDFSQFIHPYHRQSLEDLLALLPEAELVKLNKSYRSTFEIIQFAKQIQPGIELEVIERHGEIPQVLPFDNDTALQDHLRALIKAFPDSTYAALGIILKTNEAAQALHQALFSNTDEASAVQLLTPESKRFESGISILSVQMAKGLEFDAVVLPDAAEAVYHTEYDRGLLYVACTRAMHQLTLLHTGKPSALIGSTPVHTKQS